MKKFVFFSLLTSLAIPLAHTAQPSKAPLAQKELAAQDVAARKMEMRKRVIEKISQDVPVVNSSN